MTTAIDNEIARLEAKIEEDVYTAADTRQLHQLKMIRDGANKTADQREAFRRIIQTPWNGLFIHNNQANFQTILGWLHPGESVTFEWFSGVVKENPSLLSALSTVPTGALIAVDDDAAINAWLKKRGFGQSEANRNLIRGAANTATFYEAQLAYAVESGVISLARPTETEKKAIEAERAEQVAEREQRRLLNASPAELKQVIRSEAEQRRIAAVEEADRQHMAAVTLRDAAIGYEKLPDVWQGQPLDSHFIKAAPAATLRILLRRFGSAQIDSRLREN